MGDYSRVARMITHKGGLGGGGPARGGERFTNVRSQANSNWRPKQVHNLFFYRITRKVEAYISLTSIWGVPPACGPLLQLAIAQAGQGNSPNSC